MSQAPLSPTPAEPPDLDALSSLAPELAQTFVSIASDIALVIDPSGVIRNVALGQDPISSTASTWVGRRWADTVTGDTQRKVEQMLNEARSTGVTRRREVSHLVPGGTDLPVAYAAIRLGRDGPVLAVGRDLRAVAAIQQRYLESQQELERDYWRQRQADASHRLLLQAAHDAVLMVGAHDLRILQANRAAGVLLGAAPAALVGLALTDTLVPGSRPGVHELLIMAGATGRAAEMRAFVRAFAPDFAQALATPPVAAAASKTEPGLAIDLSATPLRVGDQLRLLVRARTVSTGTADQANAPVPAHEGVVITDSSGRVLMANPVFLSRHGLASDAEAVNRPLADLLGVAAPLLAPLLAEARHEGMAERSHPGGVELAATLLTEGDQECIGITLHHSGVLPAHLPPQAAALALAVDTLARQIGLSTLPELLQEASDLVERHLIEAALARSQGDPRQAALLLGIGLEPLIQRLRHHHMDAQGRRGHAPPPNLLN